MSSSLRDQLQAALGDAYLLERELGGGGMSRVFVALDRALGRQVVVKVLLPELGAGVNVERFRREIQVAAKLQHPLIVPLLLAGEANGLPYFIMPFVNGESLRTKVTREGEFPIPETLRILRDVVSALAYAHANGVIHRDIKPDNVLLSGGVACVTDFGVAKAVSASAGSGQSTGLTSLGVALGTPAYMAPEQATASPLTDHRADIYALGVMAYEMLTGSPPFIGRSAQQVLAAHVVEDPEPIERRRAAVPPMLAALVRDCLAKRPADRPQTAAQVLHILDAITTPSSGSMATTAVRLPAAVSPATPHSRKLLVASALALTVLLGAAGLWLWRSDSADGGSSSTGQSRTATAAPPVDSSPPKPPAQPAAVEPEPAPVAPRVAPLTRERRTPRPVPVKPPAPAVTDKQPPADSVELPVTAPPPAPAPARAEAESTPQAPTPAPASVPAPPPAAPPRAADPLPEIRRTVGEYARAIESENLSDMRRTYPGMTAMQQRGWEQFFQIVRGVKVNLSVGNLRNSGSTAEAVVTGTYTYQNTSTGRAESQAVSFHASFRNQGGQWRMSQVR